MKSFLSLFTDSAKSLKELRTITTTGMLLALAVAIRTLAIEITPDIRIIFAYLPMCVIGMLFGPIVCGMSTFALDIIGYIIDNKSARAYSMELAVVEVLIGILYGVFLYKREIEGVNLKTVLRAVLARGSVIIFCNLIIRSYLLYSLYYNKDFSIMSFYTDSDLSNAFFVWWTPRIAKNLIQLPIDVLLLTIVLPAANNAYKTVRKYSVRRSGAK